MRHKTKIHSQLRAQQGQDNQESNKYHHPVWLKPGKWIG